MKKISSGKYILSGPGGTRYWDETVKEIAVYDGSDYKDIAALVNTAAPILNSLTAKNDIRRRQLRIAETTMFSDAQAEFAVDIKAHTALSWWKRVWVTKPIAPEASQYYTGWSFQEEQLQKLHGRTYDLSFQVRDAQMFPRLFYFEDHESVITSLMAVVARDKK